VIVVNPGDVVTGVHELSKLTGLSVQILRKRLKRLELGGMITRDASSEGSIIKIVGWDDLNKNCSLDESTIPSSVKFNSDAIEKNIKRTSGGEEHFVSVWNKNRGTLSKCTKLTAIRRQKIMSRLLEVDDLNYWASTIRRLSLSEFARTYGWSTIDFIIENDTNHVRVNEGRYDTFPNRVNAEHLVTQ
jgi:hypothetical protein